ncbi:MAG: radical SAM protein [Bacteroidales bacterium]|nr:radical SAM protein [Bacteroidales bacterium]
MKDLSKHPCFNKEAKSEYGRIHLPIAPKCNIQCNYCNRKYDCVNESRPGVTSSILSPTQAVEYLKLMSEKLHNISVVGIAGPGDPFATPEQTLETLRLVKKSFPEMMLCLSSNGLNLYDYIEELAELEVSHVTITMNGLDTEYLSKIYPWVNYKKKMYRGEEGAAILLEQQVRSLEKLKKNGMIAKINTILIPGVNDHIIEDLAKFVSIHGADTMNIIPIKPVAETPFENIKEPTHEARKDVLKTISKYIKPMEHCARCRADAAGLIGKDDKERHCLMKKATMKQIIEQNRDKVAVASYEGMLVNQHLGEADKLLIFQAAEDGYECVETRETPPKGGADDRWLQLGEVLQDCKAILVGSAGNKPVTLLESTGIKVVQMTGLIETGLDAVFNDKDLRTISKTSAHKCGSGCRGTATGCA